MAGAEDGSAEPEALAKLSMAMSASAPDLTLGSAAAEEEDLNVAGGKLPNGKLPRRMKPGARWDGRASSLSLKDFKELRRGVDAGYNRCMRGGPSFTMRANVRPPVMRKTAAFATGDVIRAFEYVQGSVPQYSMGMQPHWSATERSPGPLAYSVPSVMDPRPHVVCPKNRGATFGTERLHFKDPPGPGPGEYGDGSDAVNQRYNKPPNFTIQGRESWAPRTAAPGPGVGEYDYMRTMRNGKTTSVHWTMLDKGEPPERALGSRSCPGPGPPHYHPPGAGAKNQDVSSTKPRVPCFRFNRELRGISV